MKKGTIQMFLWKIYWVFIRFQLPVRIMFLVWTFGFLLNFPNGLQQVGFFRSLGIYLFGILIFCGGTYLFCRSKKEKYLEYKRSYLQKKANWLKKEFVKEEIIDTPQSDANSFDFDNMDGHAFEHFCATLLEENGFLNVIVTPGSADHGIDILAEKDQITYAIQCKCYSNKIGNSAIQQAYTGKNLYKKDIAVVLTNNYFTNQAITEAQELNVKLWDREYLLELINNYHKNHNNIKNIHDSKLPCAISKKTHEKKSSFQSTKWYMGTRGTIFFLIVFFPVGIFLMWKYTNWKRVVKISITAFFIILMLITPKSNNIYETPSQQNDSIAATAKIIITEEESMPTIIQKESVQYHQNKNINDLICLFNQSFSPQISQDEVGQDYSYQTFINTNGINIRISSSDFGLFVDLKIEDTNADKLYIYYSAFAKCLAPEVTEDDLVNCFKELETGKYQNYNYLKYNGIQSTYYVQKLINGTNSYTLKMEKRN